MARYSDAGLLLENLKKQYGEELGWQCTVNMSDVGMMIEDASTDDVVEVVRCKDCKFYEVAEYDGGTKDVCRLLKRQMHEDDFCSYGKRKQS